MFEEVADIVMATDSDLKTKEDVWGTRELKRSSWAADEVGGVTDRSDVYARSAKLRRFSLPY